MSHAKDWRALSTIIAALVVALSLFATVSAQEVVWSENYGGELNDLASSLLPTGDGGFVVLGSTYSFGSGANDIFLVKIDSLGDTAWSQTYGGSASDNGCDIDGTADGGFVISGSTLNGAGDFDAYLLKVDRYGNTVWEKQLGGSGDEEISSVRQTADSGLIFCGTTSSFGAGFSDLWIIRTDSSGDTLWTKTFGGSGGESGAAIRQTLDGGFIAVGSTGSFGTGYSSMYVIRLNAAGDSLWATTYGGARADIGYAVELTADNGFIFAGASASFGASYNDAYLVKTDADGNIDWQDIYGGIYDDRAYSVCQVSDGGYVLAGSTLSYGSGKSDCYVVRVDAFGIIDWSDTYGGSEVDLAHSILEDQDNNLYIVGHSYSYSNGGSDVYFLKIRGSTATPVHDPEHPGLPSEWELAQNYPNPFNMSTTIQFTLPTRSSATLTIYNIMGQSVRRWDFESAPAGSYSIDWDGRAFSGNEVASGIYLYRLVTGLTIQSKKMLLLK